MMSINEIMTPLMDKFREKTSLTDNLTIQRATRLMDHLKLIVNKNLADASIYTAEINKDWPTWSYTNVCNEKNMLVPGKTYTFSWQARTTGTNKKIRIRIFNFSTNMTVPINSSGVEYPLTDKRQSYTFSIPDDATGFDVYLYGSAANENQTAPVEFYNCKLEFGDLATPLTEMGGVTKPALMGFVAPQLEVAA